MVRLDIVIPLYNSKSGLPKLIARLNEWRDSTDIYFRVIFVEDGSFERSKELIQSAFKRFDFQYIQLAKNYGQHTATAIGLGNCTAPFVVTIDDDLQHDPFEIDKLINHQEKTKSSLVFGTFKKKNHSLVRNIGSKILKWIFKFENVDYSEVTSFRLMNLRVARQFKNIQKPIVFIEEYLLRNSSFTSNCVVDHSERAEGKSSYSYWKLILFGFKVVLFHSSLLLKFVVRLGFFIAVACFLLGCYYIYKKIVFDAQMGFSTLIVSIFFSTGILLITMGIIGEYIRRIWIGQQELDRILIVEEKMDEKV